MHKEIGIRQLKAEASRVLQRVAKGRETYTVTRRGRTVGMIVPADASVPQTATSSPGAWDRLIQIADQLVTSSRHRKSAVKELAAMRR